MTTKQRAYLKGLAMKMDAIFQVGKCGITEESIRQISNALEARELIKVKVLETSPLSVREATDEVSRATNSECVQVIGNKFVLYRRSEKKPKIEL